ncbi:MAG: hypothetical protein R3B83_10705 [Nitrospirales bacterium]|nr:hypothetical protein [Nitrospirales bacterium]
MRKRDFPERRQLIVCLTQAEVVAHSPTPSIQRTTASGGGRGKGCRRMRFVVFAKQNRRAGADLLS